MSMTIKSMLKFAAFVQVVMMTTTVIIHFWLWLRGVHFEMTLYIVIPCLALVATAMAVGFFHLFVKWVE